eukprot:606111-Pyramimonas_sp.AAC.1
MPSRTPEARARDRPGNGGEGGRAQVADEHCPRMLESHAPTARWTGNGIQRAPDSVSRQLPTSDRPRARRS